MDPGRVVWLPDGSQYDQQYMNWACEMTYGGFSYECGWEYADGGIIVYCC